MSLDRETIYRREARQALAERGITIDGERPKTATIAAAIRDLMGWTWVEPMETVARFVEHARLEAAAQSAQVPVGSAATGPQFDLMNRAPMKPSRTMQIAAQRAAGHPRLKAMSSNVLWSGRDR